MGWHDEYSAVRDEMDESYHGQYCDSRLRLQNEIIRSQLDEFYSRRPDTDASCFNDKNKWILWTAGAMGVGKTHLLRWLEKYADFPLKELCLLDQDKIREKLPETEEYRNRWEATCDTHTQKESGYIAEILWRECLRLGLPIIIDSSLRDGVWWGSVMRHIRATFPDYKLAIIHVFAQPHQIYRRHRSRECNTGRRVPRNIVAQSIAQVPQTVWELQGLVDMCAHVDMNDAEPRCVFPRTFYRLILALTRGASRL